jgi:hypothetical protein
MLAIADRDKVCGTSVGSVEMFAHGLAFTSGQTPITGNC